MRDPRIFRLKLLIEADSKISHGARTLALRVCSHVHNDPHIMPEEPFPLPWTLASFLCWGMCESECYRNLRELVKQNHFSYEGVKGCPGFAHYKLNFLAVTDNSRAVSKDGPRAVSKDGPRAVTVARPSTVKRDSPRASKEECPRTVREECSHISTLPSEEMIKTNGRKSSSLRSEERGEDKSSLRSEERSGIKSSLRSQERTGDGKPAAPQMTSAERARCAKQVRELAAKLSS